MERFWGLAGRICYKSMHAHQLTPVKHGGSNHVQTCTTALQPRANYMRNSFAVNMECVPVMKQMCVSQVRI